jgi:carboxyl-terminal processing protease
VRLRPASALAVLAWLAVLPGTLSAQTGPRDCTTLSQVAYVDAVMRDLYYWYRDIPNLNPALFDSPEAYLEAARYRPLDQSFSYIESRAASDAFYSESQFIGYGFGSKLVEADDLRVTQVFPGSPAEEAGMARGQRILEIGGLRIADLLAAGLLGGAFGPAVEGHPSELVLQDASREIRVTLRKRLVTIPTVSLTRIYEVDGRRVGYVFFRNFVSPSVAALDAAFAELREAGVTDLVLDLRYNGGGLVSVAEHLGALIGGGRTFGQVLLQYQHNDKNSFRNRTVLFEDRAGALALPRLVVITSRASASASELIVNSLKPFLTVTTVGERTFGKPVGQYVINFCEKALYPVAFSIKNALGEGDYFDGLPVDCPAADGIDRMLGDPEEASLAEALNYVRTGACSGGSRKASRSTPRPRPTARQLLIGAH